MLSKMYPSHLRLPAILARSSRSPVIGRNFSIRRLSLQAHGITNRRWVVLQLLFSLLLQSLAVIFVGFSTRVVRRGFGICGLCFERYWVAELGRVLVVLLACNVLEGLVVLLICQWESLGRLVGDLICTEGAIWKFGLVDSLYD